MTSTIDDEFQDFMAARWPALVRTAYLLTGSHHSAEDLAQSALARAFVKWHRVRDSHDPAAYLRQIMIRCHADQFRRSRIREWLTSHLPDTAAPSHETSRDQREALIQALGKLPARQRTAVVLHFFEDMPHTQVAAALGTQESTVRSQLSRALAKLRQDGLLIELTGRTSLASLSPSTPIHLTGKDGR
ncbi:SigE family RNA polymerase sigma factor [Streptomyces sp. NPDC053431]|uniref:SigE family RNA polymerase sigma factor n=1 Tax=Streptomyces sp. NPDC053431 TaxID=3365703 RepID=UPI0037CF154B